MLSYPTVATDINQKHLLDSHVQVLAEWNMNIYANEVTTKITNAEIDEDYPEASLDMDVMFPIDEIVKPFRFGWGNNKMHTLMERTWDVYHPPITVPKASKYGWSGFKWSERWYIPGSYQKYSYYASMNTADNAGNISGFEPRVVYGAPLRANKIVAKVNHLSLPTQWSVWAKIDGTWQSVAVNPTVPTSGPDAGILELYRHNDGSWSTTPDYFASDNDNTVMLSGVGINVTQISLPKYRAELIELYAAFEADLSEYTITYDVNHELSDKTLMSPIGVASANTGSITFNNSSGIFNFNNQNSPFYKMATSNVRFIINLSINGSAWIRQATMLSDTAWESVDYETATVNLIDYSKILMQKYAQDTYVKNYKFSNVVALVLDSVGFTRWDRPGTDIAKDDYVDFFWCREEQTVWEVLQSLASSYQAGLSFDVYGVLNIYWRDYAYSLPAGTDDEATNRPVVWTARATDNGANLANIYQLNRNQTEELTKVKILYQPTSQYNFEAVTNGGHWTYSQNKLAWQAPDNYQTASAVLQSDIKKGDTYIQAAPRTALTNTNNAIFGRLSGTFTVDGKYFDYKGIVVKTDKGEREIKDMADFARAMEDNNGKPPIWTNRINLTKKVPGTPVGQVVVESAYNGLKGFTISNARRSYSMADTAWILTASSPSRGTASVTTDINYDRVGIKFKINNGTSKVTFGGVHMFVDGSGNGYYFDMLMGDDPEAAGTQINLRGYKVSGGSSTELSEAVNKVNAAVIVPLIKNTWTFMEVVAFGNSQSGYTFNVYISGLLAGTFKDTSGLPASKRAGFHVGGASGSSMEIDSFFVVNFPYGSGQKPQDFIEAHWKATNKTYKFNSKVALGEEAYRHYFRYLHQNITVGTGKTRNTGKAQVRIWDFTDNVTEYIRESVRFTSDTPCISPKIYCSNQYVKVDNTEFTPFGGRFTVKNYSEKTQFLQGTIQDVYSNGELKDRVENFYITGQSVFRQEMEHVVTLEGALERAPESAVEIQSEWIQSTPMAKRIGTWIVKRWGTGSEEYTLEIVGNPLLEIADIITIDYDPVKYPELGLAEGNNRMVVMSVKNHWEGGLATTITVRRIK